MTILFFGRSGEVKACNNSSFVINSIVDNGNGTWTYNITFTVELGSLDVSYYGSVFKFTSSSGTPTVLPGYTSPLPSGGALSSNLTGFIGANVNSQAADSDWNVYDNVTNVLSYECPDLFGCATDDFTRTFSVTVMGCVETILFDASPNSGSASCEKTLSTGLSCSTPVTPPVCGDTFYDSGGAGGNYSANEDVTYTICPVTPGDKVSLVFNTFTLQGGGACSSTANDYVQIFNGDMITDPLLGTWCGTNNPGTITSTSADGCLTFVFHSNATTQAAGYSITVTCAPPPPPPTSPCTCASGNGICGGEHFCNSSAAQSDYNNLASTVAQYDFIPDLSAANGTSYQLCYEYTTGPTETSIGFVNAIGTTGGSSCTFTRTYQVYQGTGCSSPLANTTAADFGTGFEYTVLPNTFYNFCVTITITNTSCLTIDDTYVWLYNNSPGGQGCGTCAAPCTGPGMGAVATYNDRTYLSCWEPACAIYGPTSFTNCFSATADATGFLGFANLFVQDGPSTCITKTWTLSPSGSCSTTIPNPIPNAHSVASGFNPEYSGLTPNGSYVLCVTYTLSNSSCGFLMDWAIIFV
ncbi:MAG: CUB domain-containing protein [Saprospiraceae bacterium]|nr:CUB domain-containing protein [Saprospiraceae bacterium]